MQEIQIDWEELTSAATQCVDWAGLSWSRWHELNLIRSVKRPYLPGVYRIRHANYAGLIYIGETGQKKGLNGRRLPALADNVYADKQTLALNPDPKGEPHTAAPSLVRLCERAGDHELQVSYATPRGAEHGKWKRRGIEAALIALHRLATERSPWAFERRPQHDDWSDHAPSLSWDNWRNPQSGSWMGLDWTPVQRLSSLSASSVPEVGVYRIWDENDDETLRYIGEGSVVSRLESHVAIDGQDALFSAASLPDPARGTNEKHRKDIEVELIGAHTFGTGVPPARQFNRDPTMGSFSGFSQSRLF